jgi:hypothetical protein
MAAGDVSLTFTLPNTTTTVFVSGSRTGRPGDDRHGNASRSIGTTANDTHGDDAQENNGAPALGGTGIVGAGVPATVVNISATLGGTSGLTGSLEEAPVVYFTPADIATALWLDASDSATITEVGGRAIVWNDKSGNSRHASKISTNGPLISTMNSLPSLTFATSTGMRTPSFTGFPAKRGYMIAAYHYNGTDYGALLGPYPGAATGWEFMVNTNTGGRYKFYSGYGGTHLSAVVDGKTRQIGSVSRTADTTVVHHRNGTLADTFTTFDFPALAAQVGVGSNSSNTESFVGDVPEIIVLDTAPSELIRQKLEGYLAHKWGTTASLPADHPYKTDPPEA